MISEILIASGPITYIGCWIVVILIIIVYQPTKEIKTILISYALLPIGAILQSGIGGVFSLIGL